MPHPHRTKGARALMTAAALSAAAALGLTACGSDDTTSGASGRTVKFTLNDDGCTPKDVRIPAGSTTFAGTGNSAKVTEFEIKRKDGTILGERENLTPGATASFHLTMAPGAYDISCSTGDHKPTGTLVVTGAAATTKTTGDAALTTAAVDGYRRYVEDETTKLVADTEAFVAALKAGDTQKAKDLFARTRVSYERVEPVAESFGDLDPKLDARVNDVAKGDAWTGFHRIEHILWKGNTTKGTATLGDDLLANVKTLQRKARTLEYQAPQLANGAVELLNEVANGKMGEVLIAQDPLLEESPFAKNSITDFTNNIRGVENVYHGRYQEDGMGLEDFVRLHDLQLDGTIKQRIAAAIAALGTITVPFGQAIIEQPVQVHQAIDAINALSQTLDNDLLPLVQQQVD